jgi:hypothetical protein
VAPSLIASDSRIDIIAPFTGQTLYPRPAISGSAKLQSTRILKRGDGAYMGAGGSGRKPPTLDDAFISEHI